MLPLRADGAVQRVGGFGHEAAGIDDPKAPAVPVARGEVAVARHAGSAVHDRLAAADHPVEERRLADVWSSDDRVGWRLHSVTPSSTRASEKSWVNTHGYTS